jgi:glycolate oxidase FAD binding subunit
MGAIVATSSCGALQTGFGKPRDHILGATIITADGKTLNLGGKTVKNVAGFDLLKLLPGSWGQFGIITKLIMRLHPLPEADRTLLFSSKNQHEVTTMAHKIMHTPVTLQSISIVSEGIGQNVEPTDTIIAVRILESQEAVDQVEILIHESLGSHPCERLSGSRSEAFFERLKNAHMDSDIVIRIKSLPSMLKNLIEQLANLQTLMEDSGKSLMEFIAHYESGTLLVFIDKASEEEAWLDKSAATLIDFRKQVEEKGGSLTLLIAPEMIMNQVTPWGPLKEVETIFRGLEQVFDPNQILSPYRKSGE